MPQLSHSATYTWAFFCGATANILLGASSLYWRELGELPPQTLVTYRVLISLATVIMVIVASRNLSNLRLLDLKTLFLHCVASLLLAINWGAFIWASINGHILESGFGYLLAPALSIGIGLFIYHEPLKLTQALTLLILVSLVILLIIYSNELKHWVYLLIASTWGAYTCLKKATPLTAINGLLVETIFLSICIVLGWAAGIWTFTLPKNVTSHSQWLILLAGCISVTPLVLFAYAVRKLPLSTTAAFQFILPCTQLIVALTFYKQSISAGTMMVFLAAFGVLLCLLIYEVSGLAPNKT